MAEFDIIVYGATGFAGRLAAHYLTQGDTSSGLTIALAGRNRQRLDDIAARCQRRPAVVIADADDHAALAAMVGRGKVILNFAGPFALHAEPIIAACAEQGRHYLDITGETPFVRQMIERYQNVAQRSGAKLIPCSGFDSVPGDLVVYEALRLAEQQGFELDELSSYYQAKGGVNGGTVASLLHVAEEANVRQLFDPKMMIPDPDWAAAPRPHLGPRYEPVLRRWSAPFVMAPINQAVVYRSAYLRNGAGDATRPFAYEERMLVGRAFGAAQAGLATGVLAAFSGVTRSHVGRQLVAAVSPKPGTGPSESVQQSGYFRTQLIGRLDGRAKVKITLERQGDPGNQITAILASESARLAATDGFIGATAGFLTPSVAFGQALVEALQSAGFRWTRATLN